jgi:hypothetical protein
MGLADNQSIRSAYGCSTEVAFAFIDWRQAADKL